MKKAISISILIAVFFVAYFLQTNFFTWFTISGIMPNLFIILTLFIGLFAGNKIGFSLGIIFGLTIDILVSQTIGITALLLGIIGLAVEYLEKSFSKDSKIMIMIVTIISTIFFELGYYIFKILKFNAIFELIPFLKILAIEILYNTILIIILYPIMQKMGNKLEEIFKIKKILSRYF